MTHQQTRKQTNKCYSLGAIHALKARNHSRLRLPERALSLPLPRSTMTCSICLTVLQPKDRAVLLPCTHDFHYECIARWVQGHSECSYCRIPILVIRHRILSDTCFEERAVGSAATAETARAEARDSDEGREDSWPDSGSEEGGRRGKGGENHLVPRVMRIRS